MNVNKGPNYGYGYYGRAYQQSFYSGRDGSDDNATPKVLFVVIWHSILLSHASFDHPGTEYSYSMTPYKMGFHCLHRRRIGKFLQMK